MRSNQGVFHDIVDSTQLTVVSAEHRIFCSLRQLHQDKLIKEVKKIIKTKRNDHISIQFGKPMICIMWWIVNGLESYDTCMSDHNSMQLGKPMIRIMWWIGNDTCINSATLSTTRINKLRLKWRKKNKKSVILWCT